MTIGLRIVCYRRYRRSKSHIITRHRVFTIMHMFGASFVVAKVRFGSNQAAPSPPCEGLESALPRRWLIRPEGPESTHSRRSASVGTVGKHLFFDNVWNRCRGFTRSPEIIAGNPCRNGSVYGNPAYEAFLCVHPSPIRVSVPLLLRPHATSGGRSLTLRQTDVLE